MILHNSWRDKSIRIGSRCGLDKKFRNICQKQCGNNRKHLEFLYFFKKTYFVWPVWTIMYYCLIDKKQYVSTSFRFPQLLFFQLTETSERRSDKVAGTGLKVGQIGPKWDTSVPNGTEIWSEKVPEVSHFVSIWPNSGPNPTTLNKLHSLSN